MLPPRKLDSVQTYERPTPALPWSSCLAKTFISPGSEKLPGRKVLNHCQIVGEVAREILNRMPDFLRESLYPAGSELIAAAHDIGKVSPTFQEKIRRGTDGYIWNSCLELKSAEPSLETNWGGHAGVSQAAAMAMGAGKFIPEILGQHHGYSPDLAGRLASDTPFGGNPWQEQREALANELKTVLQCSWPKLGTILQARVIAGLTSVSDWIGSGPFFENPSADWKPRIKEALDDAGFTSPKLLPGKEFVEVFGFEPNPMQSELIQQVRGPGVYVLEAAMGTGKTEAALFAAYQTLVYGQATGIYFALPTQLTSNKIHDRVNDFLQHILDIDCDRQAALLVHGSAWLKEMGEEGQPGGSFFSPGGVFYGMVVRFNRVRSFSEIVCKTVMDWFRFLFIRVYGEMVSFLAR